MRRNTTPLFMCGLAATALLLSGCGEPEREPAVAGDADIVDTRHGPVEVQALFRGNDSIWGLEVLPDDRMLFTERAGRLRVLDPDTGSVSEVSGAPQVTAEGQGGLLDVRLHPDFADNALVYLTYSVTVDDGLTTRLARGRLQGDALEDLEVLFTAEPGFPGGRHFGSRVVLDGNGYLFLSVGDRGHQDEAQNPGSHAGSVLRLTEDGAVPEDNPFVDDPDARDELWSIGNRNIQGMDIDRNTGQLWTNEHGPRGGDEINLIEPGRNYGWPEITYGEEYRGGTIGIGTEAPGMEQPVLEWTPSIAPSGLLVYSGRLFSDWRGNLFTGALAFTHLNRVAVDDELNVVEEERLLDDRGWRVRSVREDAQGRIVFTTDNGRIVRLQPAS